MSIKPSRLSSSLQSPLLGIVGTLAFLSATFTGLVPSARALTMAEVQASQGVVLAATTYPSITLTSASNTTLLLKVTPQSYDGSNWTYQVSWNRTRNAVGSVYVTLKSDKTVKLYSNDNAPQSGSGTFQISAATAGRVEFYGAPSKSGVLLLRKFFTSLSASAAAQSADQSSGSNVKPQSAFQSPGLSSGTPPPPPGPTSGTGGSPSGGTVPPAGGAQSGGAPSSVQGTPVAPVLNAACGPASIRNFGNTAPSVDHVTDLCTVGEPTTPLQSGNQWNWTCKGVTWVGGTYDPIAGTYPHTTGTSASCHSVPSSTTSTTTPPANPPGPTSTTTPGGGTDPLTACGITVGNCSSNYYHCRTTGITVDNGTSCTVTSATYSEDDSCTNGSATDSNKCVAGQTSTYSGGTFH